MRKKSSNYKNNIRISINQVCVDKITLPLGSIFNNDSGMRTCHSLGVGHNIRAQIKENVLCVKISPKIVVDLYRKDILKHNSNSMYEIEIFDWKAKCLLNEIIYGDISKTHEEDIFLLFSVIEELKNNSLGREQLEQTAF